jgi:hypothetical protein
MDIPVAMPTRRTIRPTHTYYMRAAPRERRFGIDVHRLYHDRTGRPIPILQEGEPIAELL